MVMKKGVTMRKKFLLFKESLNHDVVINKKELILTILVCVLGSILFGILISPNKHSVIGSYNGNNSGNGSLNDGEKDELDVIEV